MEKDFDLWNQLKKVIERRPAVFCNVQEIWWCAIGINIGTETCGKNEYFERPVLVFKVFNIESVCIIPITSKRGNGPNYMAIDINGNENWLIMSHARTISSRRMLRRDFRIDYNEFSLIQQRFIQTFL